VSTPLTIQPLPAKFDRIYKARDRESDAVYEVNIAQLRCSCPEGATTRAGFPAGDVRRVCAHLYDKLYATKAERSFTPLQQLFIRYGRTMTDCDVVVDERGVVVVGEPFGTGIVRAIAEVDGKAVLATYNLRRHEWLDGGSDLDADLAALLLRHIRGFSHSAF